MLPLSERLPNLSKTEVLLSWGVTVTVLDSPSVDSRGNIDTQNLRLHLPPNNPVMGCFSEYPTKVFLSFLHQSTQTTHMSIA